jgi:alkyldihydroxyacetonephosphate synthase
VTRIKSFDPHTMVAATIVFEGTAAEVALQEKVVATTAKRFGGSRAGRQW